MTREERQARQEAYEEKRRKEKEEREELEANFKKLSYRNRLLFMMVVQFMRDNPDDWEVGNDDE